MHICHVIYRFDVGGMENGIVNLINEMPKEKVRHSIITLTYKTDFARRLKRDDVDIYELHKAPGNDFKAFYRLYKLLRKLRPDIVHSRNHPTTEIPFIAKLAGVRACVHGEHGRDMHDIDGSNKKYRLLKRIITPFVDHYICVSKDLSEWLTSYIGISKDKYTQIYNGVDSLKFAASEHLYEKSKPGCVFGTVGRLEKIKGHVYLVDGFIRLLDKHPELKENVKLIIVGDGNEKATCKQLIESSKNNENILMPGSVDNVNDWLQKMDVFVLPSLAEGISNTILEAMSTALPVIATDVGGNPELVKEGMSGVLVAPHDPDALADAMFNYAVKKPLREKHGAYGRQEIDNKYSMVAMAKQYMDVYQSVLR